MKKKSVILFGLILSILLTSPVFAQEDQEESSNTQDIDMGSPFGSLTREDGAERKVLSYKDKTLQDYKDMLADYKTIKEAYEVSYGPRKVELEKKLTARGKDVLLCKMGAYSTFLTRLIDSLEPLDVLTEEQENLLNDTRSGLESYAKETQEQLDGMTTLSEVLGEVAGINSSLSSYYASTKYYVALISVHRAQYIIGYLFEQVPLVQAHMDASAALGGDVARVQEKFDKAMLVLEVSRDEFTSLGQQLSATSPGTTPASRTYDAVGKTSGKVSAAYEELIGVVFELKRLFGMSPWEYDFDLEGN